MTWMYFSLGIWHALFAVSWVLIWWYLTNFGEVKHTIKSLIFQGETFRVY